MVLIDINMTPVSGIEATQQIRKFSPASKIIGVSMHSQPAYVKKLLAGKSAEYIKENFNYVVEMFERSDVDDNEVIVEQAKTKVVQEKIDTPVVSETVEASKVDAPVGGYLSELKAQDSRSKK